MTGAKLPVKLPAGMLVPSGVGVVIPKSPQELMKMIQAQKRRDKKNLDGSKDFNNATATGIKSNTSSSHSKQEQQSEFLETKLMELEDYTNKPEGVHRILRIFEIISMETEEDLSIQFEQFMKKEQNKVELREKLRKEVEERKIQELKEREERKIAAEIRRAAVVERLRKQAEAEAKRKQDILDALLHEENEKKRLIMVEENRYLYDVNTMPYEDECSKLAESDYREALALKLWQQKEKEKLFEWEAQQKIKDDIEAKNRLLRMQEMNERKEKLIKLQQQQANNKNNDNNSAATNANKAKIEADKLNKQLRIQNKAKFVTKKIQQKQIDDEIVVAVNVNNVDSITGISDSVINATTGEHIIQNNNTSAKSLTQHNNQNSHNNNSHKELSGIVLNHQSAHTMPTQSQSNSTQPQLTTAQIEFAANVDKITTEVVLKDIQKELMAEKRTLRLEQRSVQQQLLPLPSTLSTNDLNNSTEMIAKIEEIKHKNEPLEQKITEIQTKIDIVTYKEEIVDKKLDQITHLKDNTANNSGKNDNNNSNSGDNQNNSSDNQNNAHNSSHNKLKHSVVDLGSSSRNQLLGTNIDNSNNINNNSSTLHKAGIADQSTAKMTINHNSSHHANIVGSSGNSSNNNHHHCGGNNSGNNSNALFKQAETLLREGNTLLNWLHSVQQSPEMISQGTDDDHHILYTNNTRRITVVQMEISQLIKSIGKEFDPVGYAEKLVDVSKHLKETLLAVQTMLQNNANKAAAVTATTTQTTQPAAPVVSNVTSAIASAWKHTAAVTVAVQQPTDISTNNNNTTSNTNNTASPAVDKPSTTTEQQPVDNRTMNKSATAGTLLPASTDKTEKQTLLTSASTTHLPPVHPATDMIVTATAASATITSETSITTTTSKKVKPQLTTQTTTKITTEPTVSNTTKAVIPLLSLDKITTSDHTTVMQPLDTTDAEDSGADGNDADGNDSADENEISFSDIPHWDECINTTMFTAAHHAAFYGYCNVLEILCQYFDVFILDTKHRTPLFYASLSNQLDCVAFLVALNPQWIDVGDEKGDTPLHAAAIANGIETLRFLLQCEANPDTANYNGLTPSHLARTKDALVVLKENKALLYCVDNKSRMPLWFACTDGRDDCCKFLCANMPLNFVLWPDDEGETCLHKCSSGGHYKCVEVLCTFILNTTDLYVLNKKQHTVAHVALNAHVLKVLYEFGFNIFINDAKQRNALFFASFFGRVDCIVFLLEIAFTIANSSKNSTNSLNISDVNNSNSAISSNSSGGNISPTKSTTIAAGSGINAVLRLSPRPTGNSGSGSPFGSGQNGTDTGNGIGDIIASQDPLQQSVGYVPNTVTNKDIQGDTALHAAAMCGHIHCVNLLCYYLLNTPNKQNITPEQLAIKAGHHHIAKFIQYYTNFRVGGMTTKDIYGVDFATLSSTVMYYGSRWCQGYDHNFNAMYYIDRAIPGFSQWERPEVFDEPAKEEEKFNKAAQVLHVFYSKYNVEKLSEMNHILNAFRGNYTELFISLANKYQVEDLSMFSGVNFD